MHSFYRPHERFYTDVGTESMTKQSHKAECDIHTILSQYQKTGIITHITNNQPLYTELPDEMDYQSSLNLILDAQDRFSTLPSVVRDFFGNDPGRFLAAFNDSDPAMADKLREFGLLNPAAPIDPVIVTPPSSSSPAKPEQKSE